MHSWRHPLLWMYRRLGRRYPRLILFFQFQGTYLVVLGGIGLLRVYQPMSVADFWIIVGAALGLVVLENIIAFAVVFRLVTPAVRWIAGERGSEQTIAAWRALTGLPRDFFAYRRSWGIIFNLVPISVFVVWLLGLPWYSVGALIAGSAVVLLYATTLRFLGMELIMRPVLADVSRALPDGADLGRPPVSLRWKLLAGLPAINIITGVIVAGLSTTRSSGLSDLGLDVLVAVLVAFTISLELTVLLSRSIVKPIDDLRAATARVIGGDLSARVDVVSNDETGALAVSFNQMVAGLEERQKLREAFGTYVDPALADRILEEGTTLEGDEAEVTVLFLDIRDFTAWAERTPAREVVRRLNAFYEHVVPVLARHGGHANKFVGDGLLGVFGAPDKLPDHADRCVDAAIQIAQVVREVYGDSLRIGIGVNSGPVVSGTIGGGGRVEFTVIGDTVNTAARVEEATRMTGDVILITEATRRLLREDHGGFVERDAVPLKGKTERVRLYAPLAAAAEALAAPRHGGGSGGASDSPGAETLRPR
jgi:class 3 adenylate cyclase